MIHIFEAVMILAKADVEFVIVGGVALRSHGSAYLTQDLDICYSRSTANLERIVSALGPLHPRPRGFPDELPFIWDRSTLRNGTNFTFKTTLCDIDLLGEVSGVGTYEDALNNSITVDLDGTSVRILTVDALIKVKEAAGREKDVPGLKILYALRESELDEE